MGSYSGTWLLPSCHVTELTRTLPIGHLRGLPMMYDDIELLGMYRCAPRLYAATTELTAARRIPYILAQAAKQERERDRFP